MYISSNPAHKSIEHQGKSMNLEQSHVGQQIEPFGDPQTAGGLSELV
jgi:hypothetical protein